MSDICAICGRPKGVSRDWGKGIPPRENCYSEGDLPCLRNALAKAEVTLVTARPLLEAARYLQWCDERKDEAWTHVRDGDSEYDTTSIIAFGTSRDVKSAEEDVIKAARGLPREGQ